MDDIYYVIENLKEKTENKRLAINKIHSKNPSSR